eukprot:3964484-Amphidinium_carterae.1
MRMLASASAIVLTSLDGEGGQGLPFVRLFVLAFFNGGPAPPRVLWDPSGAADADALEVTMGTTCTSF